MSFAREQLPRGKNLRFLNQYIIRHALALVLKMFLETDLEFLISGYKYVYRINYFTPTYHMKTFSTTQTSRTSKHLMLSNACIERFKKERITFVLILQVLYNYFKLISSVINFI